MKEEIKGLIGKPSIDKPWLKWYPDWTIQAKLPEQTIYDYIYKRNKDNFNRVALNYFGQKITYDQLFKNINKTALALLKNGVKEGSIVTIAMPATPETIYLFYALNKIGAISNMVDPRTSAEGIAKYINEVKSDLFFAVEAMIEKVPSIQNLTSLKKTVVVSPTVSLPLGMQLGSTALDLFQSMKSKTNPHLLKKHHIKKECVDWFDFLNQYKEVNKKDVVFPKYQKNKAATIVHTGGTTGEPKGVMLSNDNINCASYQCEIAGYDFKRYHNWLNIMPPFIAYGVGNGLHLPLSCGMEIILIPKFEPEKFADILLKYRPNHMVGVPSHYNHLLENPKLEQADLSFIVAPTVGGDTMDLKLEQQTNEFLKQHGCPYKVVKGYGMTEVNAAVAACTANETNTLGSVGIPFSHTVISIFDPETNEELGYNELGEICISGPNTMLGYYEKPEKTAEVLKQHQDGRTWVHSGDIGYMTEDGMLFITDRLKKLIVRADGFKVFPSQIEEVILKNPYVKACQVVGIKDENHIQGCLPMAHLILNDNLLDKNIAQIEQEIKKSCLDILPEYAQPVGFEYWDEFPLTAIGKVAYQELGKKSQKQKVNVKTNK